MMHKVQEWIHRIEVGDRSHWLRAAVALMALMVVSALFLLFEFQNLSAPQAMDAAQVGRQLARGEGFTTRLIRPFSVRLLEDRAADLGLTDADSGRLARLHPDLANPPLYPALLGAVFKLAGPDYAILSGPQFVVYEPDRLVVAVNLGLVILLAGITYALGRSLFDESVALLATLAVIGAELPWRLAGTGQSTLLGVVLVTLLALCVVRYDHAARDEEQGSGSRLVLAGLVGLVLGLAGLTLYGLFLLLVPVVVVLFPGWKGRSWAGLGVALLVCCITVGPWLFRNYQLSGMWFGSASASLFRDSAYFAADTLERSLTESTSPDMLREMFRRVIRDLPGVLQTQVTQVGGSWLAAFFLAGLLFAFADPTRNVLRSFALMAMAILLPAQALFGGAGASESQMSAVPYLQVCGPLVLVLGVAFFVSLLEHADWQIEGARFLVTAGFCLVAVLPAALMLMPPKRQPSAFPPYYPPMIQQAGDYLESEELMMTDIPWAVAWYGDRRAVWTTLFAHEAGGREDLGAINDRRVKVAGLYLTQASTAVDFVEDMYRPAELHRRQEASVSEDGAGKDLSQTTGRVGWSEFIYRSMGESWLPPWFPLGAANTDFLGLGQLLVLDVARWNRAKTTRESYTKPPGEMHRSVVDEGVDNP
jgi:hypothetical protein